MISIKVFDYGLNLLEENYDRKLTKAIRAIWFTHLDEHLADEEFLGAVKHSILNSRFFPTAGELVDHIHGGKEVKAVQEWEFILKACSRNRNDAEEQLVYITDRARVALKAIGGIHEVAIASSLSQPGQLSERQRLEKKFVLVYCQCSSSDRKSIAQTSTPAQSTDNPVEPAAPMPDEVKQQFEELKAKFAMNGGKKE